MINLPNSIAKGEVLSFALNKALVTAAVSDPYWSDSANISKCIVVYRSTSGRQRKRLEFDFTQESPTVAAEWSAKARNSFEIEEIVLIDFDGGSYVIQRSALPSGKGVSFNVQSTQFNYPKIFISGGNVIIKRGLNDYVAWGANGDGSIGNGSTLSLTVPTVVNYAFDFEQIDGLDVFSTTTSRVAIQTETGKAMGWGRSIHGEIGDGAKIQRNSPVFSTGTTQFSQISLGRSSNNTNSSNSVVLAIEKDTGKLFTWGSGDNYTGALARQATTLNMYVPALATNASHLTFKKVYAGGVCIGVDTSGQVYTWGGGTNTTTSSAGATAAANNPKLISGMADCIDVMSTEPGITSGNKALFAMLSNGKIYSWLPTSPAGTNASGILGNGSTTNSTTPTEIQGGRTYSQMACGRDHAAAIEAGTNKLYMWGNNSNGQLGNGTITNLLSPTLIASDKQFSDVKCGDKFTVAIEKDTNDVYVWGNQANFRLGTGVGTGNVLIPTKIILP